MEKFQKNNLTECIAPSSETFKLRPSYIAPHFMAQRVLMLVFLILATMIESLLHNYAGKYGLSNI
jgi:hypothetical protein